ncbi:ATP-binding cassette domain-containing protein [Thiomicrospira sp. ALE5]|uniref:ABC transporter ATP-binding protein n=1 Tax=Thiomicrospira sp. ALE5 TaxID=748650 RepID=UPI0008E2EA4A|nr:ATP-binding cassette domain-containing protein [Thiomicrospira sp. ALE5]SFR52774.1 ABC-type lipoprotein export system, ATPase component [Thiomicrospira sp. ALE5]
MTNPTSLFKTKSIYASGMGNPISLRLSAGQIGMISGESGSGKSQFLKALADLIEHQGETFVLDNQAWLDQRKILPAHWRKKVMYFSAETAWWLDKISAHFNEPLSDETLSAIGLERRLFEQNPDQLSSGEKQRFALLRGLAYQPTVLLLDEITANLDPKTEQQVEQLIQDYVQQHQACALWISHDPQQQTRLASSALHWQFSATAEGDA